MNRRSFLVAAAGLAVAPLLPRLPKKKPDPRGAIDLDAEVFWKNVVFVEYSDLYRRHCEDQCRTMLSRMESQLWSVPGSKCAPSVRQR